MKSDYSQQKKASQAFNKFVNYTDDLKNDPVFSSELKWFRQYYVSFDTCKPIPKNGLPFPKDKAKHDDYTMEYHYMMDKNNPEYVSVGELLRMSMTKNIKSIRTRSRCLKLNFLSIEKLTMIIKQP